jgi:hypothetical protein
LVENILGKTIDQIWPNLIKIDQLWGEIGFPNLINLQARLSFNLFTTKIIGIVAVQAF